MAHPDDEVLWASSILASADRVILCYGDFPGRPVFSAGRRRAVGRLPLRTVETLDITEAAMFGQSTWPIPEEGREGLMPQRLPFKLHEATLSAYRSNFETLCHLLEDRLKGISDVVTHNPWGEYGHEDHVQVFRAVEHVGKILGFRIWVTGYVSDKAVILMQRHLHRLGPPSRPLQTDKALGDSFRRIYIEDGVWTWPDGYNWPDVEWFFPLCAEEHPPVAQPCLVQPVNINMLQFNWIRSSRAKQTFRRVLRHARYWVVVRFPTVARIYEKLRH